MVEVAVSASKVCWEQARRRTRAQDPLCALRRSQEALQVGKSLGTNRARLRGEAATDWG